MTDPGESWREAAEHLFAELEQAGWPPELEQDLADAVAASRSVLLLDASICQLERMPGQGCPHRQPGPAPAALAERFTALRADVVEARELACVLASLTRCYHGDRGVSFAAARIGRQLPRWLEPGEPGWPPT